MGLAIDRDEFDESDHARFATRLAAGLEALRELLDRPGFGVGPRSLGAELELGLVGSDLRPLPCNLEALAGTSDARLTVEVDRFNLECNGRPLAFAGRPFAALGVELEDMLGTARRAAARRGARVVAIGILPTLVPEDLGEDAITALPRFRALSAGIRRLRGAPFRVRIDGEDPIEIASREVTLEGANTSLQIHLRAAPAEFASLYNAAQVATAPALAASGNSPLFLGHRLWEETRVALFKQAVDERGELPDGWHPPARVSFGHGWVREGAQELFAEAVALHPPLLPVTGPENDALACVRRGGAPALDELRLHQGTVWRWNRAVYDPAGGGHLRVELRALPAGPSLPDMLANAAFLVGLTLGLVPEMDWMLCALPFEHAHRNFYRAAQHGLAAQILWPTRDAPSPRPVPAGELVAALVPVARRGLVDAGVEPDEADFHLEVFRRRTQSGRTGARWQRAALAALERRMSRKDALAALLERYLEESERGLPVADWRAPA